MRKESPTNSSLKVGIRVAPRTVGKYLRRASGPHRTPDPKQRWATFVRNQSKGIAACDFFVVVTATYLAQQGWQTTGIDPADRAVGVARKRAADLGLKLETVVTRDLDYDFGESKWDLVLFSWYPPDNCYEKVIRSLKPGGVVLVERPANELPEPNAI